MDVFAWSTRDIPGIDRTIAEHRLDADPKVKPIKQRLRDCTEEKMTILKAEVQRLLDDEVIHPIDRTTWLANSVLVKKPNGQWHMSIEFTTLNKFYPNDDFHLARIDQLVDATAGVLL